MEPALSSFVVATLSEQWGRVARCAMVAIVALTGAHCASDLRTSLERLSEARRLSGDLLVQFTKAADAGNRAVMADTDAASTAFAGEAAQATQVVQKDVEAMAPILKDLGYSDETRLLEEFGRRFAEYRALDETILGLAVENTNLKAQRLSFGSAREAADAFKKALDAVAPPALAGAAAPAGSPWRVQALAATAVASVREIQALQAPHIAEPDDVPMTEIEKRMATAASGAERALETLDGLVPAAIQPQLNAARGALARFMGINAEIIGLSRRNSNVRSLALSLGQKRTLTARCEETLHALQDALGKRDFGGTR